MGVDLLASPDFSVSIVLPEEARRGSYPEESSVADIEMEKRQKLGYEEIFFVCIQEVDAFPGIILADKVSLENTAREQLGAADVGDFEDII